jgi:hypothetical protein
MLTRTFPIITYRTFLKNTKFRKLTASAITLSRTESVSYRNAIIKYGGDAKRFGAPQLIGVLLLSPFVSAGGDDID